MRHYYYTPSQEADFNKAIGRIMESQEKVDLGVLIDTNPESKKKHYSSHFAKAHHLLWHKKYNHEKIVAWLLQGLPFNPLERELGITIPVDFRPETSGLAELFKLSEEIGYEFEIPGAEIKYTSITKLFFGGTHVPSACIPDSESVELSKILEKRGFDVFAYTHAIFPSGIRIIYASKTVLEEMEKARKKKQAKIQTEESPKQVFFDSLDRLLSAQEL